MNFIIGARSMLKKKTNSLPNCHWNTKRKSAKRKQKRSYDTQEEAELVIKRTHLQDYIAYICPYCNKWHIGHFSET